MQRCASLDPHLAEAAADVGVLCCAGTVACPDCGGSPKVKRFTPDFGQALNLRGPWDLSIRRRAGQSFIGQENK